MRISENFNVVINIFASLTHLIDHQQSKLLFISLEFILEISSEMISNLAAIYIQTSFADIFNLQFYFSIPLGK